MKNVWIGRSIDVTPVLYMADGTEFRLQVVHLAPSASAAIDINQALMHMDSTWIGHASQFGSVSLLYSGNASAITAATTL